MAFSTDQMLALYIEWLESQRETQLPVLQACRVSTTRTHSHKLSWACRRFPCRKKCPNDTTSGTRAAGQRNSRVGVAGVGGGWWIFVCYGTIRCWQSPTQKPDMHVDQKSETFRHVTDMSATFPAKLTKAFTLHIHYAMCKFHDHSFPTPPPSDPDPPYFG